MPGNSTEDRRLAAIMFTDMVGYSALSQRNEALALELLEEHRGLLRSVFPRHQGQEIKSTGDGFLVEFASALAAVQCAVEIQQMMRRRNAGRSAERRVLIRIGIHLGDIVRRENDVFGDGVNIAARIEPLAEPGGICVSRAVYEQIENKVDHALVQMSKPTLKNIQATVEVYRLLLDEARVQPPEAKKPAPRSKATVLALGAVLLAVGVGAFLKWRPRPTAAPQANEAPLVPDGSPAASAGAAAPLKAEVKVLHQFGPTDVECGNGWGPLMLASDGFLYGCTITLGAQGAGSLFRVRTDGSEHKVLHSFGGTDGGEPLGGVIEGRDGALYGTAFLGGSQGAGAVFRVARDGTEYRVLHHFLGTNDCRNPAAELLEAKDGLLYGTALNGGGHGLGGVFRIAGDGTRYEVVTGFHHGQPDDPRQPMGGLVQTPDGVFHGTTKLGGTKNNGTIYRLEENGEFSVVKNLGLAAGGVMQPQATLLYARDGLLYGTCTLGGTAGFGALFRLAPDGGGFQVLRQFGATADEAREPCTPLVEGADGSLFGTSRVGGAANLGSVFRIGKDGRGYQTVHSFLGGVGMGARSRSPLTRGEPGSFFSATTGGGAGDLGVVFRLSIPPSR